MPDPSEFAKGWLVGAVSLGAAGFLAGWLGARKWGARVARRLSPAPEPLEPEQPVDVTARPVLLQNTLLDGLWNITDETYKVQTAIIMGEHDKVASALLEIITRTQRLYGLWTTRSTSGSKDNRL